MTTVLKFNIQKFMISVAQILIKLKILILLHAQNFPKIRKTQTQKSRLN
jgi:hypothetical protein